MNKILTKFIRHVAYRTHTRVEDIMSRSRKRSSCCEPRQIAMYVLWLKSGLSLKKIGAFFNRDHSTVCNAIDVVKQLVKERKSKQELIELLKSDYRRTERNTEKELIIYEDGVFDESDYEQDLFI